ncbi:acetate--CoA ligase family protein [Salinirubellus sp. GCM10025818]|uniref:acetate--CoA ligase family protein n=1 Tax=Salinirubellus TaxID=2162630 RepID=UPI0030CE8B48
MSDLSTLFAPEQVAVIGATDREGSVGRALMENLSSFEGEVLAVNPNRETVFGERCYPGIDAVPDTSSIDLAIVVVPASEAVDVLRGAGETGIGTVVVITAGFSETGDRGRQREAELIEVAEEYDLDLVGPNCVGVINTSNGLNATFARGCPPEGNVSLMSQSGAFIAAVLGWAAQHGVGFRHVVSLGNEAVLDEVDFLAEWGKDPDTDVILAYLEDIDDGEAFIETAREVTRDTPLVVIKSGRTEAGAEAAASHTGSIAGSDQAYQAGLGQAGALRAMNIQEVFDFGQVLAGQPLLDRDDVAVVTNGGGPGVLATDAIGESRLTVAEFDEDLRAELVELLPKEADPTNPLDIIGDADLDRFRQALDIVLGAETVGGAVVLSIPTALFEFDELAEAIGDLQERHGKPVVACLMGGEEADRAAEELASYGIPNYFDPARAVPSLTALANYRDVREREYGSPTEFDVDRERAHEILAEAVDRGVDYLGVEAMDLLDAYGIPTPASGLAESAPEAESIAEEIGGPVVMKIVSPDIVHKSDVGGVEVGVPLEDVRETFQAIRERATDHDPEATILGVHVEALVDPDESTETIVGAKRDSQFGHLVMFGLGGIFVQIFEDTSFRVAPVTEREAREMTEEIQAAPMLRGARGRAPADLDAVVETIQRISQLVTDFPAIEELDVNPLVVSPDSVYAIDLRLTIDPEALSTS